MQPGKVKRLLIKKHNALDNFSNYSEEIIQQDLYVNIFMLITFSNDTLCIPKIKKNR